MTTLNIQNVPSTSVRKARARYPFIVAWGRHMGSFDYYVNGECVQAVQDGAPRDAIYKRHDGSWARVGDIARSGLRTSILQAGQAARRAAQG